MEQPIEQHPAVAAIFAKVDDNAKKIDDAKTSLDKVWTATFDWASFFQTPTGKAIGVMAVTLLGLVIGQINAFMKPPTPIVAPAKENVLVEPMPIEPKKDVMRIAPMKLIVYTLDGKAIDQKAFGTELPVLVTTDPKAWPVGSYKFNDKTVVFPAGVLYTSDMKGIIDAVHYDTVDDLVAMVKAHPQGK